MSDQEWGPWIEHDGAEPVGFVDGVYIHLIYPGHSWGLITARSGGSDIDPHHPCWFWRRKRVRVGWFPPRHEWRIVCDDPAYAPILRYRFAKPRSEAVELLRAIAADPQVPIVERPEPQEAGR